MNAAWPLQEENQALEELREGNKDSCFERVYRGLREPLVSLCFHITGNAQDAEDACHDSFVSIHRALANFRGESRLSTWAYRIAVRSALSTKARSSRGPTAAARDTEDGDAAGDPHDRMEAQQVLDHVSALPPKHRIVLSLFAVQGLTHPEIAEILGIPEGTVWSRLHQARKKLTASLAAAGRSAPSSAMKEPPPSIFSLR